MKKEFLHLEYKVLFSDYSPKTNKNGSLSNVTITVYQLDENSDVVSVVGNFNYKFPTKDNKQIDEMILSNLNDVANFKVRYQKSINETFDEIVKSFDSL